MDEGRLGLVIRREERHRKNVFIMNDLARAQQRLFADFLARDQRETCGKLVKSCTEVKKSIVRQKVLRQCLDMRKQKFVTRDPISHFGQYGGTPLWAMSRDIDRLMAHRHPKQRRLRMVREAMRNSLQTGAILNNEAVSTRIEAFFQEKNSAQKDDSLERSLRAPFSSLLLGGVRQSVSYSSTQAVRLPDLLSRQREVSQLVDLPEPSSYSEELGLVKQLAQTSLNDPAERASPADEDGREDGIGRTEMNSSTTLVHLDSTESLGTRPHLADLTEHHVSSIEEIEGQRTVNKHSTQVTGTEGEDTPGQQAGQDGRTAGGEADAGEERGQQGEGDDQEGRSGPRSRLILPPIEPSKALVSRL